MDENEMRKANMKPTKVQIAVCVVFAALIFVFTALFIVLPDRDVSEQEGRALQKFPQFSLETLIGGDFTSQISDYFADQFPLRDTFVGVKGAVRIAALHGENNSVTLGKSGYIVENAPYNDYNTIDKNLYLINALNGNCQVPVTLAVAPRGADVLYSHLPSDYPRSEADKLYSHLSSSCTDAGIDYVDLRSPLLALDEAGEDIYFCTDHHWNALGAYYAYADIASALGVNALPIENIDFETASESFFGTTWRKAGMKWINPDKLSFPRYDGDDKFTTRIYDSKGSEQKSFGGFYDLSYLSSTDKYSAFIGGNNPLTVIKKDQSENRPALVVIKDSFSHSAAPYLAAHFDLYMVDLRYYHGSLCSLIEDSGAQQILILIGAQSLCDSTEALGALSEFIK